MTEPLKDLQTQIEYSFKDDALLSMALTHSSVSVTLQDDINYERLEFLGDRVLGLVMADLLYHKYPQESEGDLAKRHAALVQGKTLSKVARDIDLGRVIILSDNERASGGADNDHTLADSMEALLGAIYIDSGEDIKTCKTLIENLWGKLLDIMTEPPQDSKTALQEWVQARNLPLPKYDIIERDGPDHAPEFTIQVVVEGYEAAEAKGPSRRSAEKKAALRLLNYLENVD